MATKTKLFKKKYLVGIWGYGVMGKSALQYFHAQGYHVQIMDQRNPTNNEKSFLQKNNIQWYAQTESDLFFNSSDFIISSPGINIKNNSYYATFRDKLIAELDFFYNHFDKPIVAITGSVGKTSITHILGQLFEQLSIPVAIGGNIGIPTFNLLNQKKSVDYALLEVSSFQLEHCTEFAPHLAIWTNFYPNHLDHHATENEYFCAKAKIMQNQKNNTLSLMPLALREKLPLPSAQHIRAYFTTMPIHQISLNTLHHSERVYYIDNNCVMGYVGGIHIPLITLTPELHNLSFIDNILILASVCDLIGLGMHALYSIAKTMHLPEHRMEYIGMINNVMFYNDSKATTTASTLAAVKKLKNKPLYLFLGGLSKGVDRSSFIAQLKNQVKYVYCFGKEAQALYEICRNNQIPAMHTLQLDGALAACMQVVSAGDCVLLSPAGSSFDLYTNYKERGDHFKQLFMNYKKRLDA